MPSDCEIRRVQVTVLTLSVDEAPMLEDTGWYGPKSGTFTP